MRKRSMREGQPRTARLRPAQAGRAAGREGRWGGPGSPDGPPAPGPSREGGGPRPGGARGSEGRARLPVRASTFIRPDGVAVEVETRRRKGDILVVMEWLECGETALVIRLLG